MMAVRHPPGTQFLVYVDGATDDTAEKLAVFKERVTVVSSLERHGKSHGMTQLASLATGWKYWSLLMPIRSWRTTCWSASPFIFPILLWDACPDGLSTSRPTNPQPARQMQLIGGSNSASNALRRNSAPSWARPDRCLLSAVSSLPYVPDDIIDDFYVAISSICSGYKVVQGDDVRAYGHLAAVTHEEFTRKVRIPCQAFNAHRLLWPRLQKLPVPQLYCYLSHKFLRWFTGLHLLIAAILSTAGLVLAFGLFPVVFGIAALTVMSMVGYLIGIRAVTKAYSIGLALVATLVGIARSFNGDRFQTWTSPASGRTALLVSVREQQPEKIVRSTNA